MLQCGLLGEKLKHSYSPMIHAQLADYAYRLYERAPEELDLFLRSAEWDGLNVTIPYKKTVVPYCDVLSPQAVHTVPNHCPCTTGATSATLQSCIRISSSHNGSLPFLLSIA